MNRFSSPISAFHKAPSGVTKQAATVRSDASRPSTSDLPPTRRAVVLVPGVQPVLLAVQIAPPRPTITRVSAHDRSSSSARGFPGSGSMGGASVATSHPPVPSRQVGSSVSRERRSIPTTE